MNANFAALIAMLMNAAGVQDPEAWRHEPGFPKFKVIDGTYYWLKAPLNPLWRPAASDRVFGGRFTDAWQPSDGMRPGPGQAFIQDPSNAPDGWPLRSPAGYPLTYALALGGQPAPNFQPGVLFDGTTHTNDADVDDYVAAVQARNAALAAYHPGYTGPIPFSTLSDGDWHYLLLHPQVVGQLNGDLAAVSQAIASAQDRLIALPFDEAAYLADPNRLFAK